MGGRLKLRLLPQWGEKKHERRKIHISRYFMPSVQSDEELDIYDGPSKRVLHI